MTNRVHIASGDNADAWQTRVQASAREGFATALAAALPGVLATLGLGPDAEVAVNKLNLRVTVQGDEVSETEFSAAWAKAFSSALHSAVAPLAALGGGATSEVAVFPDRFSAEREALSEMALGLPAPWWLGAISGGTAPTAGSIFQAWLGAFPERVPGTVAGLAKHSQGGLEHLVSEAEAKALFEELSRVYTMRMQILTEPPMFGGEATTVPNLSSRESVRFAFAKAAALLTTEEANLVHRVASLHRRRWVLGCLLLSRCPWVDVSAWLEGEGPFALPLSAAPRLLPSSRPLSPSPLSPRSPLSADPTSPLASTDEGEGAEGGAPSDTADGRGQPPDSKALFARGRLTGQPEKRASSDLRALDSITEYKVEAAGLLFLIRRIARSSWLDEHEGPDLEERLIAFAVMALDKAFGPLPLASKQAVFKRQWPLIQVFAATRREPSAASFSGVGAVLSDIGIENGQVLSDAAALLTKLTSELPVDLPIFEAGIRAVFGTSPASFAPGQPTYPLVSLLLRPGRLAVSTHHATLFLPGRSVATTLRLRGLDIDPGFVPYLGRVIRFIYEEPFL